MSYFTAERVFCKGDEMEAARIAFLIDCNANSNRIISVITKLLAFLVHRTCNNAAWTYKILQDKTPRTQLFYKFKECTVSNILHLNDQLVLFSRKDSSSKMDLSSEVKKFTTELNWLGTENVAAFMPILVTISEWDIVDEIQEHDFMVHIQFVQEISGNCNTRKRIVPLNVEYCYFAINKLLGKLKEIESKSTNVFRTFNDWSIFEPYRTAISVNFTNERLCLEEKISERTERKDMDKRLELLEKSRNSKNSEADFAELVNRDLLEGTYHSIDFVLAHNIQCKESSLPNDEIGFKGKLLRVFLMLLCGKCEEKTYMKDLDDLTIHYAIEGHVSQEAIQIIDKISMTICDKKEVSARIAEIREKWGITVKKEVHMSPSSPLRKLGRSFSKRRTLEKQASLNSHWTLEKGEKNGFMKRIMSQEVEMPELLMKSRKRKPETPTKRDILQCDKDETRIDKENKENNNSFTAVIEETPKKAVNLTSEDNVYIAETPTKSSLRKRLIFT